MAFAKDNEEAFWKDFLDRNALVCEIVQNIGLMMLLAPGLYEMVLTAGAASVNKSASGRHFNRPFDIVLYSFAFGIHESRRIT